MSELNKSLVAMVSDVHFGEHQNNPNFLEMQINWFVNDLLPSLNERGIKILFILGDLFHNKEMTNNLVKKRVYDMLKNEFKDITVVVTLGNHDLYYRDRRDVHSLHGLRDLPNVKLIEKVMSLNIGNARIALVPWLTKPERENDIGAIVAIKPNVVMGHFEFAGFSFNRLYPARHGDDATAFSSVLEGVKDVFSGHYHTQSEQTIGGVAFQYLGAPFQYTRIDAGEEKGWWVYDTDQLTKEFVPSKGITQFLTINYPFEGTDAELLSIVKGNIVEVDVATDHFSSKPFAKFMDKLNSLEPYKSEAKLVGIEKNAPDTMKEKNGTQEAVNAEPATALDLIRDYIDSLEYSEDMKLTVLNEMTILYTEASASELA